MEVRGRRATVMGLGRHGGGVAVARWLAHNGAAITITDRAPADSLADSIAELTDVEIAAWRLGGHCDADFIGADLVIVNPAVRRDHPLVARAAARGVAITSELELFLERCPASVIGVTGSNGKSTTAAMIAEILRADGRETWLGGNIGRSLLPDLDQLSRASWAVLEISSFQLAWLSPCCPTPTAAVLTNFTPNHLDWHGTLSAYADAKRRLFSGQRPADIAIFGDGHPGHYGTPQSPCSFGPRMPTATVGTAPAASFDWAAAARASGRPMGSRASASALGAGRAQPTQCSMRRRGRRGDRLRTAGDLCGIASICRASRSFGAGRHGRRPRLLQRLDGHHAGVDNGRS